MPPRTESKTAASSSKGTRTRLPFDNKGARNPELIHGVRRYGRSASARHREWHKHFNKGDTRTPEQKAAAAKKVDDSRSLTKPKYYAADDVTTPLKARKSRTSKTRLRSGMTAGTVLIILAGQFAGRRVVMLKQLSSGLLLVTGPFALNGVPIRRVNAAYVITTATRLNVSSVDVSKIDDEFFADKTARTAKPQFTDTAAPVKRVVSETRKAEQTRVDTAVTALINKTPSIERVSQRKVHADERTAPAPHDVLSASSSS